MNIQLAALVLLAASSVAAQTAGRSAGASPSKPIPSLPASAVTGAAVGAGAATPRAMSLAPSLALPGAPNPVLARTGSAAVPERVVELRATAARSHDRLARLLGQEAGAESAEFGRNDAWRLTYRDGRQAAAGALALAQLPDLGEITVHPRVRKLLQQRNELLAQAAALAERLRGADSRPLDAFWDGRGENSVEAVAAAHEKLRVSRLGKHEKSLERARARYDKRIEDAYARAKRDMEIQGDRFDLIGFLAEMAGIVRNAEAYRKALDRREGLAKNERMRRSERGSAYIAQVLLAAAVLWFILTALPVAAVAALVLFHKAIGNPWITAVIAGGSAVSAVLSWLWWRFLKRTERAASGEHRP